MWSRLGGSARGCLGLSEGVCGGGIRNGVRCAVSLSCRWCGGVDIGVVVVVGFGARDIIVCIPLQLGWVGEMGCA